MPRQETQLYLALFVDIHRAKQKPNIYRSNLFKKKAFYLSIIYAPPSQSSTEKNSEQDSL